MSHQRKLFLFVAVPLILIFLGMFVYLSSSKDKQKVESVQNTVQPATADTRSSSKSSAIKWSFDGQKWQANGNPPNCQSPLALQSPTIVSKATAILYPGQTRGQYKPHGGFRFDGSQNGDISVAAPLDAAVTQGSRYIEAGEVQYMFDFVNPCGLAYRLDHLLTLSAKFQALADKLPAAEVDNSATTPIDSASVAAGEVIATAIGHTKPQINPSFDFGVYDLRATNTASQAAGYKSLHQDQASLAFYAVCWFEMLPTADAAAVKALPAGDEKSGKTSDYCP